MVTNAFDTLILSPSNGLVCVDLTQKPLACISRQSHHEYLPFLMYCPDSLVLSRNRTNSLRNRVIWDRYPSSKVSPDYAPRHWVRKIRGRRLSTIADRSLRAAIHR